MTKEKALSSELLPLSIKHPILNSFLNTEFVTDKIVSKVSDTTKLS